NGYSLSALNWIKSTKPKNEERLAGQGTDHRLSWSVDAPQERWPSGEVHRTPCGQIQSGALQHKVSGIEALACPTSSDLTYNARVANGSKGDDPITDILIWKIPVFSPTADALIAEIWQL